MPGKKQSQNSLSCTIVHAGTLSLALVFVLALTIVVAQPAQAQTFNVIHNFTAGPDGAMPGDGLIMDTAGNLYGTTYYGGIGGEDGVVFKLSKQGSGWILTATYEFQGGTDGTNPMAGVVFGPDSSLYGTTERGGDPNCSCGTVFKLSRPSQTTTDGWTETVLYRFLGGSDGSQPELGNLIFDQSGNIYGTTSGGGPHNAGTVFKLTYSSGGWTESILYSFAGGSDGANPWSGVTFDQAGNLYGTTESGGNYYGYGTVFELMPSGSGWTKKTLYSFQSRNDGAYPYAGVSFDRSGNLYGTTPDWWSHEFRRHLLQANIQQWELERKRSLRLHGTGRAYG